MSQVSIDKKDFGKTESGDACTLYTLQNASGTQAVLTNFGASLVSLECADKHGKFANVCLGYDNIKSYQEQRICIGSVVGRFANRIANGEYSVDGKTYTLEKNLGENLLHGGSTNFGYRVWTLEDFAVVDGVPSVSFSLMSKDGESGFPGNVKATVTYRLFDDNRLQLSMYAESDKKTPVSLTHHGYFNLSARAAEKDAGALDAHTFQLFSDKILATDKVLVPNGEYQKVEGTLFDFRKPKAVKEYLFPVAPELEKSFGFDQNYCYEPWKAGEKKLVKQARVEDSDSGRTMDVLSTLPGAQFYTGNYLFDAGFTSYNAFCIEPQFYPDSPNKPSFPFAWAEPGKPYDHVIEWHLGVKK